MISRRFSSSLVGRYGQIRRLASAAAAGFAGCRPSDRDPGRTARVAAGVLAAAGGGIWLMPSSFADSSSPLLSSSSSSPPVYESELSRIDRHRFLIGESFRRRVFFNYEKRMRLQSPPEKIFEYFASFRSPGGEIFMSPADLMRAVVPVFPPSESHIIRGGYLRGENPPGTLHCEPSSLFMLFDTNNDGLISFPEYIIFVTLLSIPESSFRVAFKMFDRNNNGEIEREEFKKVMAWMRSHNRQGASHRNGLRFGLRVHKSVEDAGIIEYFFGKDGNQRVKYGEFVQFLTDLHDEILRLEFDHYDFNSRRTISAKDFALSMVASADVNHINKLLDRVDKLNDSSNLSNIRITFEEFKAFAELRKKFHPLSVAIFSYGKINGLLTKQDFKRAASQVCGVSLTDNVLDVVFHVFDVNHDGNLSAEEFLRAMQKRENDIRQPTLPGIMGLLLSHCLNPETAHTVV